MVAAASLKLSCLPAGLHMTLDRPKADAVEACTPLGPSLQGVMLSHANLLSQARTLCCL